jgi:hypothetical protein
MTEKIIIRLASLFTHFIFHLIADIIFPVYGSKIAPLQQWRWMADEANALSVKLEKLFTEDDVEEMRKEIDAVHPKTWN